MYVCIHDNKCKQSKKTKDTNTRWTGGPRDMQQEILEVYLIHVQRCLYVIQYHIP